MASDTQHAARGKAKGGAGDWADRSAPACRIIPNPGSQRSASTVSSHGPR